MNARIIASALFIASFVTPLIAQADTLTVGTGISSTVTTVKGNLSTSANSWDNYQSENVSAVGSGEVNAKLSGNAVSVNANGAAGLSINQEQGGDSSYQSFKGTETSVTNSSQGTAFSSFQGN